MSKSFDRLLRQLEPTIRAAFIAAIRDARAGASIGEIARLLEIGDIDGALGALNLEQEVFDDFAEALSQVFRTSGNGAALALRRQMGARVPVRFGGHVPATAQMLLDHSSNLITEIVNDTRDAIRGVAVEAYRQGVHPRQTALDIVGRVGPGGRRTGGLIGLHSQQVDWVTRARAEVFYGDAERVGRYLRRSARDKRYDGFMGSVRDEGWPEALRKYNKRNGSNLSKQQMVDKIAGRYSDRLLKVRGDTIARNETLWAMRASQYEAIRQQIDSGKLDAAAVTLVWDATGDARTRESHAAMEGQEVAWGQPFITGDGHQLRFPGDPSLGAPGSETIQCRCVLKIEIDHYRGLT